MPENKKIKISLYELYAMGINTLMQKMPLEASQRISAYREVFMMEQRVIGLSVLMLIGEEYVPKAVVKTMPDFPEQVRDSVNQAVFLRALKHHYRHLPQGDDFAEQIITRMGSYVATSREARTQNQDPIETLTATLIKRIPPKNDMQQKLYKETVRNIVEYMERLITLSLKERYQVTR